jgi:hypothetical protein
MIDKEKFLEAFASKLGNVKEACEAAGIGRATFYVWKNNDEQFAQEVENIQEGLIDLAESKLLENIKSGKTNEILFYLRTKGKYRGYVERQEITGADGSPHKIEIEIVNKFEDKD